VIKLYNGLNVNYPLFVSQFNETGIFSLYFRQIIKNHVPWKSVQLEPSYSKRTDGQEDRQT